MTEEIIIDGVDVAECEFYFEDNGVIAPDGTPERANICTSPEKSCRNNDSCYCNKDCYYKQFKRLEQENKELKEDVLKWQKAFSRQYQINENKGYSKVEESYRSALEEINITVKQLLKGVSSNCINNTPYLTALSLIETKINEVLK